MTALALPFEFADRFADVLGRGRGVSRPSSHTPEGWAVYDSIKEFRRDDRRRHISPECDYGVGWVDPLNPDSGRRWALSYIGLTGEVYAWTAGSPVVVLGIVAPDYNPREYGQHPGKYYDTLDRILKDGKRGGWATKMSKPDGLRWVADQLAAHRPA